MSSQSSWTCSILSISFMSFLLNWCSKRTSSSITRVFSSSLSTTWKGCFKKGLKWPRPYQGASSALSCYAMDTAGSRSEPHALWSAWRSMVIKTGDIQFYTGLESHRWNQTGEILQQNFFIIFFFSPQAQHCPTEDGKRFCEKCHGHSPDVWHICTGWELFASW